MNDLEKILFEKALDLLVKDPELIACGNIQELCDPESMFEMIEQCKICGRCI